MSSCLIIQQHNEIYIGSDTAASSCINGKFVRLSDNFKKIHIINDAIVFVSGEVKCVDSTLGFLTECTIKNNECITKYLLSEVGLQKCAGLFDLELMICEIRDGRSIVRQFSQYYQFKCVEYVVGSDNINVLASGLKSSELLENACNLLGLNSSLDDVYKQCYNSIACNEIGGFLQVFRLSDKEKVVECRIKERNIEYADNCITTHLLIGDVVVGNMIAAQDLHIQNLDKDGKLINFRINEDGCFLDNSELNIRKIVDYDGKEFLNKVIIDPEKGFAIYTLAKNTSNNIPSDYASYGDLDGYFEKENDDLHYGNRKIYIGSDGNVYFSGKIVGSSIDIGYIEYGDKGLYPDGEYYFSVSEHGEVTIQSGEIRLGYQGKYKDGDGDKNIYAVKLNNKGIYINEGEIAIGNYFSKKGDELSFEAPVDPDDPPIYFKVDADGKLYATSAEIKGALYASEVWSSRMYGCSRKDIEVDPKTGIITKGKTKDKIYSVIDETGFRIMHNIEDKENDVNPLQKFGVTSGMDGNGKEYAVLILGSGEQMDAQRSINLVETSKYAFKIEKGKELTSMGLVSGKNPGEHTGDIKFYNNDGDRLEKDLNGTISINAGGSSEHFIRVGQGTGDNQYGLTLKTGGDSKLDTAGNNEILGKNIHIHLNTADTNSEIKIGEDTKGYKNGGVHIGGVNTIIQPSDSVEIKPDQKVSIITTKSGEAGVIQLESKSSSVQLKGTAIYATTSNFDVNSDIVKIRSAVTGTSDEGEAAQSAIRIIKDGEGNTRIRLRSENNVQIKAGNFYVTSDKDVGLVANSGNITINPKSGDILLNPDVGSGKVYYAGTATGNEIVKKSELDSLEQKIDALSTRLEKMKKAIEDHFRNDSGGHTHTVTLHGGSEGITGASISENSGKHKHNISIDLG